MSSTHSYEEIDCIESLMEHEHAWNQFVDEGSLGVAHRLDWLQTLLATNPSHGTFWTMLLTENREPIAFAPFVLRRASWNGIPIRELQPLSLLNPLHGTQFVLSGRRHEGVVDELISRLLSCGRRWDLWTMIFHASERQAVAFERGVEKAGLAYTKRTWETSPFLALPSTWDELSRKLQSRFRTAVRSRERNLRQAGDVHIRFFTQPLEVDEALSAVAEIEAASWKQDSGLPITSPRHWAFYKQYAARAASKGALIIPVLYIDGEPIAFDYGVTDRRVYYLLQTSYKSSADSLFPGTVLRKLVIENLINLGFHEIDFGTGDTEWKRKWTGTKRPHDIYTVYGPTARARSIRGLQAVRGHLRGMFGGSEPSVSVFDGREK